MVRTRSLEGKLIAYQYYTIDNIGAPTSIRHGLIIKHLPNLIPHSCDVLWTDGEITRDVNVNSLEIVNSPF